MAPAGENGGRRRLRPHLVAVCGIGVAAVLAYSTSFEAGLIVDSGAIIRESERVHEASRANVVDILTSDYWAPRSAIGEYRPLTTLSYLMNWAVLGNADRPTGYHAVNLLIHFGNAVLIYALCVRTLALEVTTSFFVALLFVTHPVATEAVTNVVGRADLLAAASVFGCLLLYAAARRAGRGRRVVLLAAMGATAFLGFVSKETSGLVVPVLLLFELVFGLPATALRWPEVTRAVARFARTAGSALALPLLAIWLIRSSVFAGNPPVRLGLSRAWLVGDDPWTASLTGLKAFGRALWVMVWPRTLCPDYYADLIPRFGWRLANWEDGQAILSGLALAFACGLAVALRRRHRAAAFFTAFFPIALLPILVLFVIVGGVLAERLLYTPLAGFVGGCVLAVEGLARRLDARRGDAARVRRRDPRVVAWSALAIVAVAYGWRTADRNRDWQSALTLFSDAVAVCAESYKAHHSLAGAIARALGTGDARHGTIDRVIELEETAVSILERTAPQGEPLPPDVLESLGAVYLSKSILDERRERAVGDTSQATSRDWARRAVGPLAAAAAQYEAENRARESLANGRALRTVGTLQLYDDLGEALLRSGSPDRALVAYARARDLAPTDPEAYLNLARVDAVLGRPVDALSSLVEAGLVAPGRGDLAATAYQVYQQLEPGGCAFAVDGQRVHLNGNCPAGRRLACHAASALAERSLESTTAAATEWAQAAARFRGEAERRYRCADLGE